MIAVYAYCCDQNMKGVKFHNLFLARVLRQSMILQDISQTMWNSGFRLHFKKICVEWSVMDLIRSFSVIFVFKLSLGTTMIKTIYDSSNFHNIVCLQVSFFYPIKCYSSESI